MNDYEKIAEINRQLSGVNTNWMEFGLYIFSFLMIGVMIFGIFILFVDKKPTKEETHQAMMASMKQLLTWSMVVVGILSALYGVILVFQL